MHLANHSDNRLTVIIVNIQKFFGFDNLKNLSSQPLPILGYTSSQKNNQE